MPSPATFRATGPPLRAWGGDLLPLGPFWIMCSGIGVLGLAGGGEPWMLPLLLGVMAVVSLPSWLSLRHLAREVALEGRTLRWRPYLGPAQHLPLDAVHAFEGVMGGDVGRRRGGGRGLQVRVVTAAGHRDLVIAPPLPDPGRLVASLVAAAPDATLLIPARLSLHLARYFWDGLSPVITPATDVLTLSDFRRPGVANPVGRRDRLS